MLSQKSPMRAIESPAQSSESPIRRMKSPAHRRMSKTYKKSSINYSFQIIIKIVDAEFKFLFIDSYSQHLHVSLFR